MNEFFFYIVLWYKVIIEGRDKLEGIDGSVVLIYLGLFFYFYLKR